MACASATHTAAPSARQLERRTADQALDLLIRRGVDHGRAVVAAQCVCGWSADGHLLVVREAEDDGWVELIEVHGEAAADCDWCERDLLSELLIEYQTAAARLAEVGKARIAAVPVACASCGWDCDGHLILVDDAGREIGYWGRSSRVENADDPEHALECPNCGPVLNASDVVLRAAAVRA